MNSIAAEKTDYQSDVRYFFEAIRKSYAFFESKKVDWKGLETQTLTLARNTTKDEYVHTLEWVLSHLYDPHTILNTHRVGSWKPIPNDLWVQQKGGAYIIGAVRRNSSAEAAGMKPGHEILLVNEIPVDRLLNDRKPKFLTMEDPDERQFRLLSIVSGQHGVSRKFRLRDGSRIFDVALQEPTNGQSSTAIEHRLINGNIGYVRIPNFFSNDIVADFDITLENYKGKALILDVRDNPGGDTLYAKPMLGRFLAEKKQYAIMSRVLYGRTVESWKEFVEPRGPWRHTGTVVVLINHFSASMAEGFAMAVQDLNIGKLVGTNMAGLGAAIKKDVLPQSQIGFQYSAEPVFRPDGKTRNEVVPDYFVDEAKESGQDPILEKAITVIARRVVPPSEKNKK